MRLSVSVIGDGGDTVSDVIPLNATKRPFHITGIRIEASCTDASIPDTNVAFVTLSTGNILVTSTGDGLRGQQEIDPPINTGTDSNITLTVSDINGGSVSINTAVTLHVDGYYQKPYPP